MEWLSKRLICFLAFGIITNVFGAKIVPDFKSIMANVAGVDTNSNIDGIISKLDTNDLFNNGTFLLAMTDIGFVNPSLVQILSTIELNGGTKGFNLSSVLKELGDSSGKTVNVRDKVLSIMNIPNLSKNIDYKQLFSNDLVKQMLTKQGIQPLVVSIAMDMVDVTEIFGAVNFDKIITYSLIAEPSNKTFQQIILQNVDFTKAFKGLKLHAILTNPILDTILKTTGIPTQLLHILQSLDFDKLPNVINITQVVAAAFDYNAAKSATFIKDLIDAVDLKELPTLVDVNKLVDAVLNVSNVYSTLAKAGIIDPSFLKAFLDDINLNDVFKIIDFKKIYNALAMNGTTFENLLKISEMIDLNKLLPDVKLNDILKLPKVARLLNQTGVDPKLIVTIVESVDLNTALKSFNFTGVTIFDFMNTTKILDTLIQSTDFNMLLKSINVDRLFAHPTVADFFKKQFNMEPVILKLMLKSVDVDKLVKAVDVKQISKMIVTMLGQSNQDIIKKIESMLNFDKLLASINFNEFLTNAEVKMFLKKLGVDPVILELLATIGVDNILKQIDIGKVIQTALLEDASFSDIMKQIMQNIDITKILRGVDWDKIINGKGDDSGTGGTAGKSISSFLSIACLQDLVSLMKTNFSNADMMKMMNNPQLQMLDAMGKPSSRFLLKNVYWMGAYDECNRITNAKYCISQYKVLGQVTGMYGACVPKQCNAGDVKKMLDILFSMTSLLGKPGILKVPDFSEDPRMTEPVMCEVKESYSTGFKITLMICVLFIALCLLGSFVEYFKDFFNGRFTKKSTDLQCKPPDVELHHSASTSELTPDDNNIQDKVVIGEDETVKGDHFLMKFFISFSIRKNVTAILSTDTPKGAINSINGVRTISMFWVIVGHSFMLLLTFPTDNMRAIFEDLLMNNYAFMGILSATVSVDSFFLLSGLLVSYLTLKRMDKQNGKINLIKFYLHRFLRITPVYMFVILFWTNIMQYLLKGPAKVMSMFNVYKKSCTDYWWTNLLYINNLHPKEGMCLPWSWYLANDMQFYIVAPGILYLIYIVEKRMQGHRYRSYGAFVIIGALTSLFIIITAALISGYDLATLNSEGVVPGNPRSSKEKDYNIMVYNKPYTRIPPYLIGILLGYIFSRDLKFAFLRKTVFNLIGWAVAFLVAYGIIYGPAKVYKSNPTFFTDGEQVMYGAFSRTAWALSVAWVIYACENKSGGIVNSFLSWKVWLPLGRLSFGAYLIHPFIMVHFLAAHDNPLHYQNVVFAYEIISITAVTYFCSFLLAVFVEYPLANLEKALFHK